MRATNHRPDIHHQQSGHSRPRVVASRHDRLRYVDPLPGGHVDRSHHATEAAHVLLEGNLVPVHAVAHARAAVYRPWDHLDVVEPILSYPRVKKCRIREVIIIIIIFWAIIAPTPQQNIMRVLTLVSFYYSLREV